MIYARVFVSVVSVLWGLVLCFDLIMILMSGMMFDSPGSENNPAVLTAFYAVLGFPIVLGFALGFSYQSIATNHPWYAVAWILVPAINVLLLVTLF